MQSTNEKLRARAERTVMHATGCTPDQATEALAAAEGSVKLAIVLVETGVDVATARAALESSGGNLRRALAVTRGDRTAE
ncbi:hypothetical protein [Microbacterium esteraromaticum]|uniref:hypothetical protein n=1 Tax=Microbacterium esteraromaticum TaxID=57043 RepID=UPI002174FE68|nr:hypothetical protein [Microbacterium esteraromaticum]